MNVEQTSATASDQIASQTTIRKTRPFSSLKQCALCTILIVASLLILCSGLADWRFGSIRAGLMYLGGDEIVCAEPLKLVSRIEGDIRVTYRLLNTTSKAIGILGSSVSCSCITVDSLPRSLEPGVDTEVSALISREEAAISQGQIKLLLDSKSCPEFLLLFTIQEITNSPPRN